MPQITVKDALGINRLVAWLSNTGKLAQGDSISVTLANGETLPLPAGAATEATMLAALGDPDDLAAPADGSGNINNTSALRRLIVAIGGMGLVADAAPTGDTGNITLIGGMKRNLARWTTLLGNLVAEGAAAATTPFLTGGVARASHLAALPADGTVVRQAMTRSGAATVKPYAPPELDWSFASAAGGITVSTDVVMAASAGVGIRNYLTSLAIKNAHATMATEVVIKSGTAVLWRGHLAAAMNTSDTIEFPSPLKTAVATALTIQCVSAGAQVYVSAQGYVGP